MRSALAVVGGLVLLSTMGCAMCANPYDCSYAAYGGRIQRVDRVHGRVGSILDPSAGQMGAPGTSMVVPASGDEQVFGEPSPMAPQTWESGPAESEWPLEQQPVEITPWQPDRDAPPGSWTEETLPEPADRDDVLSPQLPELDRDPGDF